MIMRILYILIFIFIPQVHADSGYNKNEVQKFINFMHTEHNYNKKNLNTLFSEIKSEERIKKYIKKAPERTLLWNGCDEKNKNCTNYKKLFVTKNNITRGLEYWRNNKDALNRAEKKYGIPPEIIISIIGIESKYGSRTGSFKTFDTLASLSLGPNKGRRAKFYRSELVNFLLLCRENALNPRLIKGSYAGALGKPQFISSSYRHYAVDFNNDDKVDLWSSNDDVIGSVANYFNKHGWRTNQPVLSEISEGAENILLNESKKSYKPTTEYKKYQKKGIEALNMIKPNEKLSLIARNEPDDKVFSFAHKNFYVITRYNRSRLYALAVHFLSVELRKAKTEMERL
tara:strand:+ start:16071 stop:17099 length:1029 start_codon:yes stop_codon:yes gene_type:complete